MATKVFVSYDYENDRNYRNLLSAWHSNPRFQFTWDDHSTPKINSEAAGPIKAAIARKMAGADCLLAIVGAETADSSWVAWEIEKAKELGLCLVGVKLAKSNVSPAGLLGVGTHWATSFTEDAIASALREC